MTWLQTNWVAILAALLALDKLILLSPLASNSIVQLVTKALAAISPTPPTA